MSLRVAIKSGLHPNLTYLVLLHVLPGEYKFRATTTPSQPQIRRPLPSPQRYRHIPGIICEINSSIHTLLYDLSVAFNWVQPRSYPDTFWEAPPPKKFKFPHDNLGQNGASGYLGALCYWTAFFAYIVT